MEYWNDGREVVEIVKIVEVVENVEGFASFAFGVIRSLSYAVIYCQR